ncbi:MAG: phage tail length tape measure family protein [Pseudomonadota bacterium]
MDVAQLGLSVDSSQVVKADKDLDGLSKSAKSAAVSTAQLENASETLHGDIVQQAQSTRIAVQAQQIQTAAMKASTAAVYQNDKAMRQLNFRRRQFMFQSNDIISGLLMGQPPMMVAMQQGGQLAQIYGGPGGVNDALSDATNLFGGLTKRFLPLIALTAAFAAGTAGMTKAINDGSDANVKFGDTANAAFSLAKDGVVSLISPIQDDLTNAFRMAWQTSADLTAQFVNYGVRRVLTYKAEVEAAFALIAATGEWTWESIRKAAATAGEQTREIINTLIKGYNRVALVTGKATITPLGKGDVIQDVESLRSRYERITEELQKQRAVIATTDYAGKAFDALKARTLEVAKQREAAEAEEKIKDLTSQRERLMSRLATLLERAATSRLRQEGNREALIMHQRDLEIKALEQVAAQAVASGASRQEVEAMAAQARVDIMMAAQDEIEAYRKTKREKELAEEKRHAEKVASLNQQIAGLDRGIAKNQRALSSRAGDPNAGVSSRQIAGGSFGVGASAGQFGALGLNDEALDIQTRYQEQLDRLNEFEQQKIMLLQATGQQRLDIEAEFAERRTALEGQAQREQMQLMAQGQFAMQAQTQQALQYMTGNMGMILGQNSKAYRALLIMQKGAALNQALIALPAAISEAWKLPFPMNIAQAALAASTVGAQIAQIRSIAIGNRQQGGPVYNGRMVEVGEGGRPELYRVGDRSFLVPGSGGGRVDPEQRISGGLNGSHVQRVALDLAVTMNTELFNMTVDERARAQAAPLAAQAGREGANAATKNIVNTNRRRLS